jgi:hypothetical protein
MTARRWRPGLVLVLVLVSGAGGCGEQTVSGPAPVTTPGGYTEVREPCAQHNPLRNAYFGDLHVHTTYSFDAHAFEVRTTPAQAYGFARGEPVALPPLDAQGNGTRMLRIDRPLDFAAVTDHSEYLGEVQACTTPDAPTYNAPTCVTYRGENENYAVSTFGLAFTPRQPQRFADICGADGSVCRDLAGDVWQRIQAAADAAYDRRASCAFTTFVAYEYSASPGVSTMHRNVIFRNDHVPFPTSVFEQATPQGLWAQLKATCLDTGTGCDVLAIPHNSNESNGNMFAVEYPGAATIDDERAQAAFRARMEPLVEIFQHKGDSECFNGLSGIVGAPDELCEFEKRNRSASEDCFDKTGQLGTSGKGCLSRLDFVRGVLLAGLQEGQRLGVNPYRLGIIASTDTHNGTPGATAEAAFVGHRGTDDDTPAKQLGPGALTNGGIIFNPGGLVGVWAEENSRPSLFDALRRRETFGTSGTRISVRFFGGWNLTPGLCGDPRMLQTAYARAVPMGGTLAARPAGAAAPTFLVAALRDPGTAAHPGTPLQRVQVIKGWIENGEAHQQIYDVAGDPTNGASADPLTCEPRGSGHDSLCAVWTDPAFDPTQPAFYYARAVENPTCRWSTYVCNALPADQQPKACHDPAVPTTIQERAWSSPVWYEEN